MAFVTFLSDFGLQDEFVGVCHGVILQRAPQARIIDIAHGVPPQDVRAGAVLLAAALPYTPPGVHLAVVDPGVGSSRRAIALRTASEDRYLVGPDNGLLIPAAERFGGVAQAVEISASPLADPEPAPTFHGRDLFAPVAGELAAGRPLAELGKPVAPATLVRLPDPLLAVAAGAVEAEVVLVDRYGNLSLAADRGALAKAGFAPGAALIAESGGRRLALTLCRAYADVERGARHGLLVSADFQSAGRGRQGRSWWARPGEAILASLLLRPVPPLATLRAAVAIREAIGGRAQIKWPNDLLLPLPAGGWGKVCGILGEEDRQGRFAVLGFGINVAADPRRAPAGLQGRVATLGPPAAERGRLLAAVLAALERWLAAPKEQVIAAL